MELIQALWKPGLFGVLVLLIGCVSGWGMSGTPDFILTRLIRWWVLQIIVPFLKRPSWLFRATAIFVNNATICIALVAIGALPSGAWVGATLVGLAMGVALRVLGEAFEFSFEEDRAIQAAGDPWVRVGFFLNMLELPAIYLALGLALGQVALPITQITVETWRIVAFWIIPLLAVAAGGESLWMGRQRVFQN